MAMQFLIVNKIMEGLNNSSNGLEVQDTYNQKVVYFRKCDEGIIIANMLPSNNFIPSDQIIIPNIDITLSEYFYNNYSYEMLLEIYKKLVIDKRI